MVRSVFVERGFVFEVLNQKKSVSFRFEGDARVRRKILKVWCNLVRD